MYRLKSSLRKDKGRLIAPNSLADASIDVWISNCRCVSADFIVREIGAELLQLGGESGVHFALLLGSQKSRRGALLSGAHHKGFAAPRCALKRGEAFVNRFHVIKRRLTADFPNDWIGNTNFEKLRHPPHGRFQVSFH